MTKNDQKQSLNPFLLSILACPSCKNDVRYDQDNQELTCDSCQLAYRVEDGVPVMLIDEARKID